MLPSHRISLHVRKPKPLARVKKMIDTHRPCDWLQYNAEKNMGITPQGSGDGNVTAATNKTHNPTLQPAL